MNNGRQILTPAQMAAMRAQGAGQAPQNVVMQQVSMMNDMQALSLVAAHCPGPAEEAVDRATKIFEAAQRAFPEWVKRMNAIQADQQKAAKTQAQTSPLEA